MPESSQPSNQPAPDKDGEVGAQEDSRDAEETQTAPVGAGDVADAQSELDDPGYEAEYVHLPGGLHRITTRRITHRHDVTEDIEETIREVIPMPYQGPLSDHPAPVG